MHEQTKTMQKELLIRSLRGPLRKKRRNGLSDKRDFAEIFLKLMWISIMSYFNQLWVCHVSKQKEYKTKHIEIKANGLEITYFPTVENWLSVTTNQIDFSGY